MFINYLGHTLYLDLVSEVNDYMHVIHQCLRISNMADPGLQIRWAVIYDKVEGSPAWKNLRQAIYDVMWVDGGIIARIKRRLKVRKHAKYLTNNAKGASAKSFRKVIKEACL